MPPLQAVSIVVVMSVVSGLQGVWLVRHSVRAQTTRLARFLQPALFGIPIGIATLTIIDPRTLKLSIAAILLLYGGFFTLRATLPKLTRRTPVIDVLVGFLGGVLGGAASLSGALPTMWCALRPWPKAETRALLQPFNVVVLGLTMVTFAFTGVYTADSLKLIAIVLPLSLICAQIGISIFKRLGDDQFRRLVIALMFVSGAVLMTRELLW
jgi:uncharacterized membrane protein YfcA